MQQNNALFKKVADPERKQSPHKGCALLCRATFQQKSLQAKKHDRSLHDAVAKCVRRLVASTQSVRCRCSARCMSATWYQGQAVMRAGVSQPVTLPLLLCKYTRPAAHAGPSRMQSHCHTKDKQKHGNGRGLQLWSGSGASGRGSQTSEPAGMRRVHRPHSAQLRSQNEKKKKKRACIERGRAQEGGKRRAWHWVQRNLKQRAAMHGKAVSPKPELRAEGCAQAVLSAQRHLRGSPHMGPPTSDWCTPKVLMGSAKQSKAWATELAKASSLHLNILHCIGLAALLRQGWQKQAVCN